MRLRYSRTSIMWTPESRTKSVHNSKVSAVVKGAVHNFGEICPRSDPDIADMRYYRAPGPGPSKV